MQFGCKQHVHNIHGEILQDAVFNIAYAMRIWKEDMFWLTQNQYEG